MGAAPFTGDYPPPEGSIIDFRFDLFHQSWSCDGYDIPIKVFDGPEKNNIEHELAVSRFQSEISDAIEHADMAEFHEIASQNKSFTLGRYASSMISIGM